MIHAAAEERSADLAMRTLIDAGITLDLAKRVRSLIVATDHRTAAVTFDELLMVDIDLSVLGAPQSDFERYEESVRAEYAWVPEADFTCGRRAIVKSFLDRPEIFSTAPFRGLEPVARVNLRRSIARLRRLRSVI